MTCPPTWVKSVLHTLQENRYNHETVSAHSLKSNIFSVPLRESYGTLHVAFN